MRKGASIKTWFPTLCAACEWGAQTFGVWMPLLKVFKQANTQGRTRRPHNKKTFLLRITFIKFQFFLFYTWFTWFLTMGLNTLCY